MDVEKNYLITVYSSSRSLGFTFKIKAVNKEDAERKACNMFNNEYFTVDLI